MREQELENVSAACYLEASLNSLSIMRDELLSQKPQLPEKPKPPKRQEVDVGQIPYPEIQLPYISKPFELTLSTVFFICIPIVFFAPMFFLDLKFIRDSIPYALFVTLIMTGLLILGGIFRMRGNAKLNKRIEEEAVIIKSSPEYSQLCKEVDAENERLKIEAEEESEKTYEYALEEYESKALPTYEANKAEIVNKRIPEWEEALEKIDEAIAANSATLDEVYSKNVIPGIYRNREALVFINSFMGTSQYDLKFAIERYDKDLDHIIARENLNKQDAIIEKLNDVVNEEQYANYLKEDFNHLMSEGNDLLRSTRNWTAANTLMHGIDEIRHFREKRDEQKA